MIPKNKLPQNLKRTFPLPSLLAIFLLWRVGHIRTVTLGPKISPGKVTLLHLEKEDNLTFSGLLEPSSLQVQQLNILHLFNFLQHPSNTFIIVHRPMFRSTNPSMSSLRSSAANLRVGLHTGRSTRNGGSSTPKPSASSR